MTRKERIVLATILAVAFALRIGYLVHAQHMPGYVWEDPDAYVDKARALVPPGGWRWSFGAVAHIINGQRHALPPLYTVFLSLFLLFPGFPMTVQIAQVALGAGAAALVFALGRRIHSTTAGLIAAGAYAVWTPNILGVWSTSQETLYLPLVLLSFVLFLRAVDRGAGPMAFGLAGVSFGAAALTRSMPLFFVVPAACAHVLLAADRRRGALQGAAFLAGFLTLIVPYSVALSRHLGHLAVVDTHGSIHLPQATGQRAPGPGETARQLWQAFAARPGTYILDCASRARSLLHVNGGRQLQIYVVAADRTRALAWKALVHVGTDALLVISSIFAALGAALSRQPRLAVICVLWIAINVAIASVGGFSGARLRVPFEPFLFVLAAVVFARGWRRPHAATAAIAVIVAAAPAFAVLPQVPNTLRAWPDYGVRWPSIFSRQSGQLDRSAGINVPAYEGVATFSATLAGDGPLPLHVRAGGVHVRSLYLAPGEPAPVRALWPARGLAFIELELIGGAATSTVRVDVEGR